MRLRQHRSRYLFAVSLLALVTAPLPGQVAETPEQVAARYLQAMSAQQWDTMAALMHPGALSQLRSSCSALGGPVSGPGAPGSIGRSFAKRGAGPLRRSVLCRIHFAPHAFQSRDYGIPSRFQDSSYRTCN